MGFLTRYLTRHVVLPYAIVLTVAGIYSAVTYDKPINLDILKDPAAHFTSAIATMIYNSYKMIDRIGKKPIEMKKEVQ